MWGDDIIVSQNILYKIIAVHTITQGCRFQIYPLWNPVSKNSGFTLPKHQIHLDEMPIRYKVFMYTAKRVSVWTGPKIDIAVLIKITIVFFDHIAQL